MADVSKTRGSQQQHFRNSGGTHPPHHKCSSVGERLYSQVHVCNHARCAANDPDYNVKSAVPPKKFLVAKKHAYGGLEEKREKTKSDSSTTSSDRHHRDRSHALQSLTNSVLTTENGKARSNGLRSNVHNGLQNRRAWANSSSDSKKVAERKARSTTPSGSSTGRSIVTTESHSKAQKSRLSNASSIPSPTREHSKRWEDSASVESTVTSIRITQIFSTTRGEGEEKEEHIEAAAYSPTASVGSNFDTELSSLNQTLMNVEAGMSELLPADLGDFQSPASESSSSYNFHKDSLNEDSTCDPPPSVHSRPPDFALESSTPSTPSTSFASTAPERSSITPRSEISASSVLKSDVGEDINYNSPLLVKSRPAGSESLKSSVTSTNSEPRTSPTSTGRSSRTVPPPPSPAASKLAREFINNLKESSKVGSPVPSSSRPSASKPSRISRNLPVSTPPVDSSPGSTSATRLTKEFITDLQAKTVARKASRKGVRSIELRGGKAQSYSTTTVTSWNVTTTAVETSTITPTKQYNMKESQAEAADLIKNAKTTANTKAPSTVKFVKNAKSLDEVQAESEKVSLKHGEVAERRLSEEYMTNHALEKKISDNDHRVKVLVHAFETLATLSDSEVHVSEDKTLNPHLVYESVSATSIAV